MVWREVLRGLYEGRYKPGQRLTEAQLTREYGVSRSSVREALSRLTAEGVVSAVRHRGVEIRSASKNELLDILAVLDALITLAARLAALNIEAVGAREAAQAERLRLNAPHDTRSTFDLARDRNRFYRVLLLLSRNNELRRLMSQVHVHALRMHLAEKPAESTVFVDYLRILEAILAGDDAAAAAAAHDHVAGNIAGIQAMPERLFTPRPQVRRRTHPAA